MNAETVTSNVAIWDEKITISNDELALFGAIKVHI